MRRRIRSKQRDLFAAPATAPLALPAVMHDELASLLSALLLEVIAHRRSQALRAQPEPYHEQ
jgi:hypothetical protein